MTRVRTKKHARRPAGGKDGDRRRRRAARRVKPADRHETSRREAQEKKDSSLDPATRLATLSVDSPEVSAVDLPHRRLMEDRFGRSLDGVRVLTGPGVSAVLDRLGARAAEHDGEIFLRSADEGPGVVAHEVAHTLQRQGRAKLDPGNENAPTLTPSAVPGPDSRVEADARRAAVQGGPPTAVLPPGTPALLQQGQSPGADPSKSPSDAQADPSPDTQADAGPDVDSDSQAQNGSAQDPAADPSAGDAQPAVEQVKPTFAPPAVPDTQLSPEEQAARQAEMEAAKEQFDQADSAGGAVEAVKNMPPSAKAIHQAGLGTKMGEVVAKDQENFVAEAPTLEAKMAGDAEIGEVPKVEAPAIGDVQLAKEQAAPAQKPDLPPTPEPGKYQGNAQVKSLLDKFFSLFGFGKESIDKSFKEVKTGDSIETSPGEKPKVPRAKGTETDDERIDEDKVRSKQESEKAGLEAQQRIVDGPGPEQVKPREHTEARSLPELQTVETPTVVPAEGAQALQDVAAREDPSLIAQFDKDQHESMQQSLVEAQSKTAEAEQERDAGRKAELDKAEAERKAIEEKADVDQRAKVLDARKTIQDERQKTVDAQAAEVKSVETQAETARKEERGKIQKRVEDDERSISTKYDEKEGEAKKEVEKGEIEADKEKKKSEKESENQSWWDRATSWVKEQFEKLTSLIGKIFDGVRALVKKALDAARQFAKDLIDAAAAFIKNAIEAFGELVKGLVNVLVGTFFPDLAKKLNEAIDGAVALAKKGVDVVAEQMKKGVDAIVDTLQKGIDAVLNAFQAALNFAVSLVQAALTGDWGAVFKQLLEAALKLLGIDPKEFYAFIAKVQDTLGLIVDKPGQFLSNVLGAVKLGFSLFAGNFLKHLKAGIIGWLTGSLGGDITIPKTFDLLGILDLVRQLLGLTWEWLKKRAAKVIGEKNVERLEFLFSYVDTLRKEGWGGLFERLKEDLAGLKEKVLGQIGEFLVVQVVKAGVLWLAGLFNPVGALVKVVMTVWNIYTFLRDQLSRMIEVVKTVVGALDKIARGVIEEAGKKVESVLGLLVPVAIDLLAKLLGLTGVTAKVRSILKAVNESITKTVDKVLKKVAAKFKRGKGKGKGESKKKQEKARALTLGKRLPFGKGKEKHTLFITTKGKNAQVMMRSDERPVDVWLKSLDDDIAALPDAEKSAARNLWIEAKAIRLKLDGVSDDEAAAWEASMKAGRSAASPAKGVKNRGRNDVQELQESLVTKLGNVIEKLGLDKGKVGERLFADEIGSAPPVLQESIKKSVNLHADKIVKMTWKQARARLVQLVKDYGKPLKKGGDPREKLGLEGKIQSRIRTISSEEGNPKLPQGMTTADFLHRYFAGPVHSGDYPKTRRTLREAVFKVMNDNQLLDPWEQELVAAMKRTAAKTGPDANVKKEAKSDIVKFLSQFAEPSFRFEYSDGSRKSFSEVWGHKGNMAYIGDRIRANKSGRHEWIPVSVTSAVVAKAATSTSKDGVLGGVAFVVYQDELRTPTKHLVYQLKDDRKKTFKPDPSIRRHGSVDLPTSGVDVLQGHVGAVYAPIESDGSYSPEVKAQTAGTNKWHDAIRDRVAPKSGNVRNLKEVDAIAQSVIEYYEQTVWDGSDSSGSGFTAYYKSRSDAVDWSVIQGRQSSNFNSERDSLREAKNRVKTRMRT